MHPPISIKHMNCPFNFYFMWMWNKVPPWTRNRDWSRLREQVQRRSTEWSKSHTPILEYLLTVAIQYSSINKHICRCDYTKSPRGWRHVSTCSRQFASNSWSAWMYFPQVQREFITIGLRHFLITLYNGGSLLTRHGLYNPGSWTTRTENQRSLIIRQRDDLKAFAVWQDDHVWLGLHIQVHAELTACGHRCHHWRNCCVFHRPPHMERES